MQELGGPGGDLGTDRYQAAMAGLKRDAPAYAKHQQALAAANKGDLATARRLANEAAKLQPRESRFHGLLGDIEMAQKNPHGALPYFQKASSSTRAISSRWCRPASRSTSSATGPRRSHC